MKLSAVLTLIVPLAAASLAASTGVGSGDDRLYRLIAADWEYQKRHSPALAELSHDWRWMNSWPDLRRSSIRSRVRHDSHCQTALRRIKRMSLSNSARVDLDLFLRELGNRQREVEAKAHLTYFSQFDRFGPSALHLLTFIESEPAPESLEGLHQRVNRLIELPSFVDQQIQLMREARRLKMLPPRELVQSVLNSIEGEIAAAPDDSVFGRSLAAASAKLREPDIATEAGAARRAIVDVVKPALGRLHRFLSTEYLPRCPAELSLLAWPNGNDIYRVLVSLFTTSLSPAQFHETGLAEVARISKEMENAVRQTGHSGSVQEFIEKVQSDQRFHFRTEEELLNAYRAASQRVEPHLSGLFGSLSWTAPLLSPRRMGPAGPGAAYGRGTVLVNVSNPELRPGFEVMTLMLHEGLPGHHLQRSLERERTAREPSRVAAQRLRRSDAFNEGWALYAETLGYDMGLYDDPYQRFGQLRYEMIRAVRMVIDTGIHSRGWSRDKALRYFVQQTGKSVSIGEGEIRRAVWDPGSLISYKAGELALRAMRRRAEAALGSGFDIGNFHEFLLRTGPLPLDVLEVEFDRWLNGQIRTRGREAVN